jgi:hypothetical protein
VSVEGPGLLDVTAWRNADSVTIHLVILTNPMAMKGPYRDFFPVGPQTIKLNLPIQSGSKEAQLLVADKRVEISHSGSTLSLRVPAILDHEVVAIDL